MAVSSHVRSLVGSLRNAAHAGFVEILEFVWVEERNTFDLTRCAAASSGPKSCARGELSIYLPQRANTWYHLINLSRCMCKSILGYDEEILKQSHDAMGA